jgi:hypothetical protein
MLLVIRPQDQCESYATGSRAGGIFRFSDEAFELDEINRDFSPTGVAFVIGANDVINPRPRPTQPRRSAACRSSRAKTVLFVKYSMASGYVGVDSELFYRDNTMLFGDTKKCVKISSKRWNKLSHASMSLASADIWIERLQLQRRIIRVRSCPLQPKPIEGIPLFVPGYQVMMDRHFLVRLAHPLIRSQ